MAIDERLRLNIHAKLTELLGSEEATALIEHIMPVPWTDVATKDDLQLMRADIDGFRAEIRADMADLRTEMHQGFTAQTRWLMGYVTALSAIMLAVAQLLF
jgi:hypothetical protein